MRRLLPLLSLALAACDEDAFKVPLAPPGGTPQLVAHGLFAPGEPWAVQVSESAPLNARAAPRPISNATVEVYRGTTLVERLAYAPPGPYDYGHAAAYTGTTGPQEGVSYTLRLSVPGLGTAQATDAAPPAVVPRIVAVRRLGTVSGDASYARYEVEIEIQDPAGPSFYRMGFGGYTWEGLPAGAAKTANVSRFCSSDPVLRTSLVDFDPARSGQSCFYERGALFSGETFDGQTRTLTVTVEAYTNRGAAASETLSLERLSADAYRYEQSRRQTEVSDGNPFVDPVDLHDNLSGGIGLFAGRSEARATFPLPAP